LIFFGNILADDPNTPTILVLTVGWISFSILVLLRVFSFLHRLKERFSN
jgi:hypothetical protein